MNRLVPASLAAVALLSMAFFQPRSTVDAAGPVGPVGIGPYRVLAPIESGDLTLFPVVREGSGSPNASGFVTLDEGIKSGQVEVTEAGRVRGLVRPRGGALPQQEYRGDQVNTLVLVNNSGKPLLLLAGEVVTGGKQDRVIAKDRIVPADGDPIDLSVFCIEPGRWTESSASFGASNKAPTAGFMVQPTVREQAMAKKSQQEVWDSVNGSVTKMARAASMPAAAPPSGLAPAPTPLPLNTTSYAKAMNNEAVNAQVDKEMEPLVRSHEQVLNRLHDEHAVGVVVAVRGEIVWADIFADPELLSRYWTKLVRSYAAESLTTSGNHAAPSVSNAQHFLDMPTGGAETSEGEVGIYRYSELKSSGTETFILESLLPGTDYDLHLSKLKLRDGYNRPHPRPGIAY
jgi:hypothetical protein